MNQEAMVVLAMEEKGSPEGYHDEGAVHGGEGRGQVGEAAALQGQLLP